ncbi:hypothetical protein [Natronorubrum sp. FCH18a]|uniref:hypothetical protein n=1 Tax=Natronorubrum sp. FCH18a TaxID=3447018 RepID=UPI003F518CAC
MSQRQQTTRRTVLRTLGSLGTVTIATSAVAGARTDHDVREDTAQSQSEASATDGGTGANQYIGVVDRIVDGEHVVILLEDDGELVDQHVAPRSEFDDVDESDILLVVIKDGELLTAQQLPKRPGRSMPDSRKQRSASDLADDLS